MGGERERSVGGEGQKRRTWGDILGSLGDLGGAAAVGGENIDLGKGMKKRVTTRGGGGPHQQFRLPSRSASSSASASSARARNVRHRALLLHPGSDGHHLGTMASSVLPSAVRGVKSHFIVLPCRHRQRDRMPPRPPSRWFCASCRHPPLVCRHACR